MDRLITAIWDRLPLNRKLRSGLVWLFNAKFTVGVIALVQDEAGRVLLFKHTYRRDKPWGLPGGSLQPGESLERCLARELREETGMEIEVGRLLSAAAHPERRRVDTIFACRLAVGEGLERFRPSAEVSEARFFALDDLPPGMYGGQSGLIARAVGWAERAET
ncbi:MAG: NUDIX domain-containing protein [Chloroflexota bacterium]|nr:NUDIX domain-containing protein [Chloroflexota bacterium]MDQ5866136.1 NUDIX domain-containing protein [Chloroflexota bacterium]